MRRLTALVVALTLLLSAGAGAASAQPPAPAAQPQGSFLMTGTVTVAHNVRGEHVGQVVHRTWTFTPQCPTAPCPTVQLARSRAAGTDTLLLHQTAPGIYTGAGSFYAPLRCAGRIYSPGVAVPFLIKVRVRAANGPIATAISATYMNRSRVNLTPCVALRSHDAARYAGQPAAG